jgi:hypothetical protein
MWFDQVGRVLQLKQEVMYRAFNRNGIEGYTQKNTLYVCFFLCQVSLDFSIDELCGY